MTAPRRWKDTPNAPVGVRELLSAGRAPRAIDRATFERGATRVAKLGAAPAVVAVALGGWAKLAAAAVIGLAGVGAVVAVKSAGTETAEAGREGVERALVSANADANADANANANANANAEAEAEAKVTADAKAEADAKVVRAARVVAKAAPGRVAEAEPVVVAPALAPVSAAPATLGAELALLEEARAALARDPSTALVRVAQHRARFPSGVLGAERDLIELDALRRAGRTTEARDHARTWLEREPSGLHAPRVRAILAALDRTPG